jgi:TonB-linked SusC/RagA family outer membrane protein
MNHYSKNNCLGKWRNGLLALCCLVFMALPYLAYAQQTHVTITVTNETLRAVLDRIEKETVYRFTHLDVALPAEKNVSLSVEDASIESVLHQLLAATSLTYRRNGNTFAIIPRPQPEAAMLVKGQVTDINDALPGATIAVKGTTTATVADVNGKYSITVPNGNAVLVFSFLGFTTQEITVGSRTVIDVTLAEDAKTLDEVVVIGYGTQSKKTLTAAVSVMNMNDIEAGTQTSVAHALAGKAAGLHVQRVSAQPGGASTFKIRGQTSINAGNDPLFVIDGFPVSVVGTLGSGNGVYQAGNTDNILESLNPDDIESISVLKDAASTSIYGARAGHGVILITTKRGKSQKAQLTYSGNYSIQRMDKNYQLLDAKQFMEVRNMQEYERYLATNGLGIYRDYINKDIGFVPPDFVPRYSEEQIARGEGTDWIKEITRNGIMHQHNVSLTAGTEATRVMASLNYMKQEGIVKNNNASRFAARLNLDQDINKYISLGITAFYTKNTYDNVPLGSEVNEKSGVIVAAFQANPTNPIYDDEGNWYINPESALVPNTLSLLTITDITEKDRITATGFLTIKPLDGLTLKALFGADKRMQERASYVPSDIKSYDSSMGNANIGKHDQTDYLVELTANYVKTFEAHSVNVLAGYSRQRFTSKSVNAGNKNFLFDDILYYNLGMGSYASPPVGSGKSLSETESIFARAQYNYLGRYLLEANFRADHSSFFTKENAWAAFPSVSAGWVLSEESFMEPTGSWLSTLKLRASWGQTGNDRIGEHVNTYYGTAGDKYALWGTSTVKTPALRVTSLANTSLKWETTTETNVGIDAGFLKNRVKLSVEYFSRVVSDLLYARALPSHNEVSTVYDNIGKTGSKGIEITVNSVNIARKDFEWSTTLTLSHTEDRWVEHFPGWAPKPYEGNNDLIRCYWDYEVLGLMQPGEAPPRAQLALLPGGLKVKDQNNDGVINDYDKVFMGTGDPQLIYGMNNAVRYKSFDFNAYFYGEAGVIRNASYLRGSANVLTGQNGSIGAYDVFSHNNLSSTHPSPVGNSQYGSPYLRSIYFIRLGTLTLGYTVPAFKSVFQKLRVYVDANNLFCITNWDGLDPETDTGNGAYPNIKSYNIGVNITF